MFGKKRTQPTIDDQETQLPPDPEQEPDPDEDEEDPGPPDQPAEAPAEPLSAGQYDQQGKTWDDSYTAATDNPAHPLRHLKGV